MTPRFLVKTVGGYKTTKKLLKRCKSERNRERIYNENLSNVNDLRKGRGETSVVRPSRFPKADEWSEEGKSLSEV